MEVFGVGLDKSSLKSRKHRCNFREFYPESIVQLTVKTSYFALKLSLNPSNIRSTPETVTKKAKLKLSDDSFCHKRDVEGNLSMVSVHVSTYILALTNTTFLTSHQSKSEWFSFLQNTVY
jgi:hypothetical protein